MGFRKIITIILVLLLTSGMANCIYAKRTTVLPRKRCANSLSAHTTTDEMPVACLWQIAYTKWPLPHTTVRQK